MYSETICLEIIQICTKKALWNNIYLIDVIYMLTISMCDTFYDIILFVCPCSIITCVVYSYFQTFELNISSTVQIISACILKCSKWFSNHNFAIATLVKIVRKNLSFSSKLGFFFIKMNIFFLNSAYYSYLRKKMLILRKKVSNFEENDSFFSFFCSVHSRISLLIQLYVSNENDYIFRYQYIIHAESCFFCHISQFVHNSCCLICFCNLMFCLWTWHHEFPPE